LLGYALSIIAISRIECLIIAVTATTTANPSVSVRASKASINRYLLYFIRELRAQPVPEIAIILFHSFANIRNILYFCAVKT